MDYEMLHPFMWDFPDNIYTTLPSDMYVTKQELAAALESIILHKNTELSYDLLVQGQPHGTIEIPECKGIENITFDGQHLIFEIIGECPIEIDISSLVTDYEGIKGIEINHDEKTIEIKKDGSSEDYLVITEDGIKIEGVDALSKKTEEITTILDDKAFRSELPDFSIETQNFDIVDNKGNY